MKSTNVNLVHFISLLSLSSLMILTVYAQTNETNSPVTGKTNLTDVKAIASLLATFDGLISKSIGDPCLPTHFSWVNCSSNDPPRITEINLSQMLSGSVLPDFSAMDALEKIDLSLNRLTIEFPDFLANFPKLKVLKLMAVPWNGTVPTSLWERSQNKTLELMLSSWGTDLCYSNEKVCPTKTDGRPSIPKFYPLGENPKNNTVWIVLGILLPILLVCNVGIFICRRRQKKNKAAAAAALNPPNLIPIFSKEVRY